MTVVVEYDPAWTGHASTSMCEVRAALSGVVDEIEHIGSTSVPGLAAKPIIDLMAAAPDLDAVIGRAPRLGPLGYALEDNGMSNRVFFHKSEDMPVNLHVVPIDTWADRNQRILRDYLRSHPEDVRRYGDLKLSLAARGDEGLAYGKAKTALIQELVDRARSERGLPLVDVWET